MFRIQQSYQMLNSTLAGESCNKYHFLYTHFNSYNQRSDVDTVKIAYQLVPVLLIGDWLKIWSPCNNILSSLFFKPTPRVLPGNTLRISLFFFCFILFFSSFLLSFNQRHLFHLNYQSLSIYSSVIFSER